MKFEIEASRLVGLLNRASLGGLVEDVLVEVKKKSINVRGADANVSCYFDLTLKDVAVEEPGEFPIGSISKFISILGRTTKPSISLDAAGGKIAIKEPGKKLSYPVEDSRTVISRDALADPKFSVDTKEFKMCKLAFDKTITVPRQELVNVVRDGDALSYHEYEFTFGNKKNHISVQVAFENASIDTTVQSVEGDLFKAKACYSLGIKEVFKNLEGERITLKIASSEDASPLWVIDGNDHYIISPISKDTDLDDADITVTKSKNSDED